MKPAVLDASALLAMFFGQPGMEQMRELFHKAADSDRPVLIAAVNWAQTRCEGTGNRTPV
jgi:PIN domain nuclease of toxin-antitoxin system